VRFAWIDSLFAAPVTVSLADLCQGAHWLLGGGLEGVFEFLSEFLWSSKEFGRVRKKVVTSGSRLRGLV
jgi:hypothetical protein